MGFSVVLFGTPLGYKYEKIDIPTGDSVCPDSMARFDSFEVHKLGLRPSEQIWVIFKQMTEDGQSVIGLGLYQSAYEYNQDRSGGYYGVGLLLQDVNCNDFEKLKNITERIFSLTSKFILENNKHNDGSYKDLKSALINHGTFNNCKEEISSLLINETVPDEDLAKLKPSYLYACSKDISKTFDFLMKNKDHFDSFVCFGIDTPETKQSIEQLGNKKLYSTKDLITQLDTEIKNGVVNTKESRLRSAYQTMINAKKQSEKQSEELSNLLKTKTQKIKQLELDIQSLGAEAQEIEQERQVNQEELEDNKERLAALKLEMKQFGQETGRELLVAKPKQQQPETETLSYPRSSSSPNLVKFDEWPSNVPSGSYQQRGQPQNGSGQRRRSHHQSHNKSSDGNMLFIVLCVVVIALMILVFTLFYKDIFPDTTHNSDKKPNIIQPKEKDKANDFDNHASPNEKQQSM